MSQIDTIRLLVINDDASEVERMLSMLKNSGRSVRPQIVPSEEGLEKLLADQSWDLMLAVDSAKSCEPKNALRLIKKLDKDVPVIFLTEVDEDERNLALIDGLRAGARDVVTVDDDQHLLLVIAREITNLVERRERRSADRRLREAERRCQQLLDSSRDAIAYVEDGMFLYANQSFAERFGYADVDDILVMPVVDIIATRDQDTYKQFMKNFKLSDSSGQEMTLHGLRNDGSEFNISITVDHASYENEPCVQLLVAATAIDNSVLEAELKKASSIDALTGLYNRVYMTNAITSAIHDAAEKDKYRSLHIISIDRFEEIRSSIGLSARDAAMADLAAFIKNSIGSDKILGRIADDEFAVLVSGTDEEQQLQFARELVSSIADHICDAAGKTVQVTVSIGICPITEKVTTSDQVMERAHLAGDEVRAAGKNGVGNAARYYVAKVSDTGAAGDEGLLVEIIENALKQDKFTLKYQPVISLRGDPAEHYETLLGMMPDENGKTLTAEQIFSIANHHDDLGKKIDRWLLLNAAKTLASHRAAGSNTRLILNITLASLKDEGLPAWLSVALKTANLPPETLIFQFSENDAGNHINHTRSFCSAIKAMGSQTCVKHFGCSLDPFKLLEHIDVDMVKVDGSFTTDIQQKNEKPDTLKEMLGKIHESGKQSIVPFVENATVLATLWQAGAHFIQGHYVQAPSEKMDFVFSEE